ncbi:hypothetical protein HBI14_154630 [Parastagonospora nodorum]|nr:hypothetical protein HBI14_154630 [Parastagonospora nodorum]
MLLCWIIKLLSIPSADKYSKKHLKVREADALKQVDANVREEENKNRSSLYYSNSNSDTATRKTRIKACARLIKRQRLELEAQLRKASKEEEIRDSLSARLIGAYILYFKELLSNNSKIFASDTFTLRTRQKCKMPKQKSLILQRRTLIIAIDPANSILCDLSDLLVIRFCIFSNSALENIGILTNKEVIIAEANMPAMHSKATKHCLALLAARFILVCSFRKIDRHVFRANNTISGRTVFNKFYNCKLEGTIIAKFYKDL